MKRNLLAGSFLHQLLWRDVFSLLQLLVSNAPMLSELLAPLFTNLAKQIELTEMMQPS